MFIQSDGESKEKDQENWEGGPVVDSYTQGRGSLQPVGISVCSGSENSGEQRAHSSRDLQPKQRNNVEK